MGWFKRQENETYRDFNNRVQRTLQLLVGIALVLAMLMLLSLSAPR